MKLNKGYTGGSINLLILSLLEEQDRYGYEIIETLEERSSNVFSLKEGTLYPVLHRLEKKSFITSYHKEGKRGRDRKYYQLTEKGKTALEAEKQMWKTFKKSVDIVTFGEVYA